MNDNDDSPNRALDILWGAEEKEFREPLELAHQDPDNFGEILERYNKISDAVLRAKIYQILHVIIEQELDDKSFH